MAASTRKRGAGVWLTDAPPGWVGIVVYDRTGRLRMHLEVDDEAFSDDIVEPLKAWAQRNERVRLAT